MTIGSLFKNPTVYEVIFQARFNPILSVDQTIGKYQLQINDIYPHTQILQQRSVEIQFGAKGDALNRYEDFWRFTTEDNGVLLNIHRDQVNLISKQHKTYDKNIDGGLNFRHCIFDAIDKFLHINPIKKFTRIGLRYKDKCPLYKKTNDFIEQWYNMAFNNEIIHFDTTDAYSLVHQMALDDNYKLIYKEELKKENEEIYIHFDFDAFKNNINTSNYQEVVDQLHNNTSYRFEQIIKGKFMSYLKGEG